MHYQLVNHNGNESLSLVIAGEPVTVPASHGNYATIKQHLLYEAHDESSVRELLDANRWAGRSMARLSERVTYTDGKIMFDGDTINTTLSRHIIRLMRAGHDYQPVVQFMEHLASNPSSISRKHLWTWLTDRDFTLTPQGHIIAYKSVSSEGNWSMRSGSNEVRVNGKVYTGRVSNPIGAVVEMARTEVNPDRDHGCSTGLHVGTWEFAEQFGRGVFEQKVLTVQVNPRDVVAVPRDAEFQKMRVCRYTVTSVATVQIKEPVTAFAAYDPDDFDEEYESEEWEDYEDEYEDLIR